MRLKRVGGKYQFNKWFNFFYNMIIIIIIEKGRQCKTGRERFTPYQFRDTCFTILTYIKKQEKVYQQETKKDLAAQANKNKN